MKRHLFPLLIFATTLVACSDNDVNSTVDTKAWTLSANMDSTVNPGDNFFMYCNGKWYNSVDPGDHNNIGTIAAAINNLNTNTKTTFYYGADFSKKATSTFTTYRELGSLVYNLGRTYTLENGEVITRSMFVNNGGMDYMGATVASYTSSVVDLLSLANIIINTLRIAR